MTQKILSCDWLQCFQYCNSELKEELSNVKEDFERLQDIFETRNNVNKNENREVDVELADIREQFRVTTTENEFLR